MFALLALTALIPLAAPVFPTQDGPVHLYYADVLRGVLTHAAPYAQHFAIKRALTPYALEYYSLLVLETVLAPAASEKVLVACYIFTFGLGFRYLVESVTEKGSPWILAAIPFCMHMLVYMGFLNYCFAVALLLFACGMWIRIAGRLTARRAIGLFGVVLLMLLTHPVPVAVFLVFMPVYFVCDAANGAGSWRECLLSRRSDLATMAGIATMALVWVSLFVDSGHVDSWQSNHVSTWGWFNAVATELQLYHLAPFTALSYRAGPILAMAFAFAAWIAGLRRGLRPAATALLVVSGICFLVYCLAPERVSGGYYFAERFPILWLLFLLAGASSLRLPPGWSVAAGTIAVIVTIDVLGMQWVHVREIASRIELAEQAPTMAPGSVGLIIGRRSSMPDGLSFNPYMWSGVHLFRRSRAILANDPWMNGSILMLRPARPDRWSYLDPDAARQELAASADSGPDFVVQAGMPDFDLDQAMNRSGWSDSGQTSRFIRVYRRQ
jgi:hypothetical protein